MISVNLMSVRFMYVRDNTSTLYMSARFIFRHIYLHHVRSSPFSWYSPESIGIFVPAHLRDILCRFPESLISNGLLNDTSKVLEGISLSLTNTPTRVLTLAWKWLVIGLKSV